MGFTRAVGTGHHGLSLITVQAEGSGLEGTPAVPFRIQPTLAGEASLVVTPEGSGEDPELYARAEGRLCPEHRHPKSIFYLEEQSPSHICETQHNEPSGSQK